MVEADQALSLPIAGRKLAYRFAIPAAALCLCAIMAALWTSKARSLYFDALHLLGVEPFRFPFIDTEAVLAAAECRRQGVDVYVSNPCDALGRPHVYSPLWLTITPGFLGRWATGWVGQTLDLLFILSWIAVLRPRNTQQIFVFGLAAFSPVTVYALERGNNDLVVFLIVLCAGLLSAAPRPYRLCSYVLYLVAGLLKYYPLVLLMFVARERRRDAVVVLIAAGFVLTLFGVHFYAEMGKALANIPTTSYFTDSFSAANLPFGYGEALTEGFGGTIIAVPLWCALLALAVARTVRTVRLLDQEKLDWNGEQTQFLSIAALLVTACFFAGHNINYRGIYFLLVVPGLVHVSRSAVNPAIRRFSGQMIAAALFVMWEEFFRRALHTIAAPVSGGGLSSRAEVFFWLGRELVWWWLIAGLTAIVVACFRHMPATQDSCTQSPRAWMRFRT